jgi:hypothetical protein
MVWIAAAMVGSEILSCALRLYLMSRYENTSAWRTIVAAAPVTAAAATMGVIVYASAQLMTGLPPAAKLAACVLIGAASYGLLILALDRESAAETRALLRRREGRSDAGPVVAATGTARPATAHEAGIVSEAGPTATEQASWLNDRRHPLGTTRARPLAPQRTDQ